MSIGSVYYFDYKMTSGMSDILEAWENTLETNDDDFTVIDNEEGDYGIIRYLDTNGVAMLTKVVQAGDIENTYFTDAGIVVVRKLMQDNFNDILEAALIAGQPTAGDLTAHIPPEIRVIDLVKHAFPDEFGRFDLVLYEDGYFMPFVDSESAFIKKHLFWCDEKSEYLRAGRDLYATMETWRARMADRTMTVGVHKKGLYDLIRVYKELESIQ